MVDESSPNKPERHSGYRERIDPRGQPGEEQKKDGRQLPEDTNEVRTEPGANVETSVPEQFKRDG